METAEQSREDELRLRWHAAPGKPCLVYLPGLHGDWTLVGGFRQALAGRAAWVEMTYPRTLTWTLADYARRISSALSAACCNRGWLVAESFGSQIAWAMLADDCLPFRIEGVILAGGFVAYSPRWLVRAGERVLGAVSARALERPLRAYARFVSLTKLRPVSDFEEFVKRRTELDKAAAMHRLRLIASADPGPIAERTRVPVFHLAGMVDPIVWWGPVRRWLRRRCPGFAQTRIVVRADHTVLGSAPQAAADQILAWIAASDGRGASSAPGDAGGR